MWDRLRDAPAATTKGYSRLQPATSSEQGEENWLRLDAPLRLEQEQALKRLACRIAGAVGAGRANEKNPCHPCHLHGVTPWPRHYSGAEVSGWRGESIALPTDHRHRDLPSPPPSHCNVCRSSPFAGTRRFHLLLHHPPAAAALLAPPFPLPSPLPPPPPPTTHTPAATVLPLSPPPAAALLPQPQKAEEEWMALFNPPSHQPSKTTSTPLPQVTDIWAQVAASYKVWLSCVRVGGPSAPCDLTLPVCLLPEGSVLMPLGAPPAAVHSGLWRGGRGGAGCCREALHASDQDGGA